MSSPCARTQASASWPGVMPFSAASSSTCATRSRFCSKFSPWKRGLWRRKSSSARSSSDLISPERKPRPSGLYGTKPIRARGRRQDLRLRGPRPQRVLGLERCDRMDRVRAADRLGRSLGEAKVADLAGFDELLHRADRLLDRQCSGRRGAGSRGRCGRRQGARGWHRRPADVVGRAVDAEPAAVGAALVAEFGREHDLVAAAGDRAADESLVGERPVHVGGVEERDAEVERAMDRGDRFVLVRRSVELGHAHAAEADRRDLEAVT